MTTRLYIAWLASERFVDRWASYLIGGFVGYVAAHVVMWWVK